MSWILTMMIVGQVVDLMWKNRADFELDWFWAQSRAIVCISDLRLTSIWIESEYEFERDKCAVPWRSVKIKMYAAIMLTWMFRFSPAAIIYLNRRGKCFISTIQLWKWNNHSTLYQEFNQSDRHQSRRISYFIYFSPCSLSLSLSLFPSFPPFLPPSLRFFTKRESRNKFEPWNPIQFHTELVAAAQFIIYLRCYRKQSFSCLNCRNSSKSERSHLFLSFPISPNSSNLKSESIASATWESIPFNNRHFLFLLRTTHSPVWMISFHFSSFTILLFYFVSQSWN